MSQQSRTTGSLAFLLRQIGKGVNRSMDKELIWFWKKGYIKAYIDDLRLKQNIERWTDVQVKLHCYYFFPNGRVAWDFIIPSKFYNRIAKLLKMPLRTKNQNRVKAGKKVSSLNLSRRFTRVSGAKGVL